MYKYKSILLGTLASISFIAQSQNAETVGPLEAVKPTSYYNPISPIWLCADPTAIEYEGRLYLYGSNDQQEYDGNNGSGNNTYGKIKSIVVLSTTDMVNWTHHTPIDMAAACGSWFSNSWAPSIVSRVESDGLTHFYMYFSNGGGGVGVVTSTSPLGPWKSPINHILVSHGTPGLGPCSWPFDPGVVIDDNGVGWLTLGGGDPVNGGSSLLPGNAHIVKLGADMASLDGNFAHIPAPYEFEASELNMIGGKYVYTYCSSWSDRNAWSNYGSSLSAPSTCSMCYMVSDNPLDENNWEYKGIEFKNPGEFGYPWGNNHTHLHKYNGKYYLFYHTQVMERLAGIQGAYRSLAVNMAEVDEDNQTIKPVTATNNTSLDIAENRPQALEVQQAEMMWNAAGVSVQKRGNNGNTVVKVQPGGWIAIKNVEFGDNPVDKFTAKLRGTGTMEIRLDRIQSKAVGTLEYSSTTYRDATVTLDKPITGRHTVYLLFTSVSKATTFDSWQFSIESEGITDINTDAEIVSEYYYTLDGICHDTPCKGINIHCTIYASGTVETEKIVYNF